MSISKKKIIAIVCRGLNGKLLIGRVIARQPEAISLVVEVPIVPHSPKTRRPMAGTSKRLRQAPYLYLLFQWLVFHFSAALSAISQSSVAAVARRTGVPVRRIEVADDAFLGWLEDQNADLILNASALILSERLIAASHDGVLNCHAAPLPEFRGPANAFWMLDSGIDKAYGTMHFVSTGVDSGPVVAFTEPRPVDCHTTALGLWTTLREDLSGVLDRHIRAYRDGRPLTATPQDEGRAVQRTFPDRHVMQRIRMAGFKVFGAREILHFLRMALAQPR